ncbi:hypothetical protein C8J56DRAFT_281572 [Mycena floridula]|nr:hypothetical protein C8J56DRAFT_281572 [Mycena floridula]
MGICSNSGLFSFTEPCVRETWAAVFPTILVLSFCIFRALPSKTKALLTPIRPFLTAHELEEAFELHPHQNSPVWRTFVLSFLGLVEALCWSGDASYKIISDSSSSWDVIRGFLMALVWLYAALKPVTHRSAMVPFDLFTLYCVQLIGGVSQLGGTLFDNTVYGDPLPSTLVLTAYSFNLVVIVALLAVTVSMPLALPGRGVKKEDIGNTVTPEDYTTLFGWLTFNWVYPLIHKGRYTTLDYDDVWNMSPTIQSRWIFKKFCTIQRATLLRRLWAANAMDLILDFSLTLVSVGFNYCNPYFLKRILEAIDEKDPAQADRSRAYVYALLMFITSLAKAEADAQHLWHGRRAATRLRASLMASIYDKALKRRDYSGIIDKAKLEEAADKKAEANKPKGIETAADKKQKKKEKKEKDAKADEARAGADTGKIVNLMAGDALRVSNTASGAYFLYGAPVEIIIGGTFLYQLMGISAFAGFVVLIAGWPLNSYLMRRAIRINKGTLTARDKRMGALDELIKAVKFIKFFAWEDRWIERVLLQREAEMKWMVKSRVNSILFSTIWISAPILVSVISFFVYVWMGNVLTISVAFTAIALFNMIRAPLNVIPAWTVNVLNTGVALNRIAVYLQEDEVTAQVSSLKRDLSEPRLRGEDGLGLEKASFKWNEVEDDKKSKHAPTASDDSVVSVDDNQSITTVEATDHKFELRDLTVMFPEGGLSLVTGPTASGKTALLMALLGEMTLTEGRIIMDKDPSRIDEFGLMHAISYAAQSPWLRHQSIKDNILFGYPLDEERYKEVIQCCALTPDLEVLEDGDATEIGARGVSLSGGQKARVALARAVYAQTKYVLLDDPLSAVDSHTSRVLYEKLLRGPLLANRTVVLVTHHVDLVLPGADFVVRMLDGRIDTQGTVKELRAQGILDEIVKDESVTIVEAQQEEVVSEVVAVEEMTPEEAAIAKKPRKLIKDEHREEGGVKWSIYNTYLKASSYYVWAFLLFIIILSQLIGLSEKIWIMIWGDAYKEGAISSTWFYTPFASGKLEGQIPQFHSTSHVYSTVFDKAGILGINWPNANEHPLFYVAVFAFIGLLKVVASISNTAVEYTGALRASRTLFRQLLVTVVRATFRFHDTTPQGRMLNRFGKDIETIDSSLAGSIEAVNFALAGFLSSILTVAFVFPLFLIPATFLGFIYRELALGYLNCGRDLRRMESNTRSPIFSDFGELLEGIVTVRAFSAETRFLDNLHKRIDTSTKMWYNFWMTNRWLLLNFDALGSFAVFITALLAIAAAKGGAGLAGLSITSAMSFTSSVYWACRFWTALELDLNSVERVVEYLELPQEPPAIIESNRPPAYWPSNTSDSLLTVENLVIKYAPDLPAVIQNVSFSLKAGERVGLLGRTGSGKSTLAMSILRFVDPVSGQILIDGIDISQIGIYDLRSRLTFIPQDATLFSGTLRDNLDPFHDHEDSECLDVLHRVQMITDSQLQSQRTSAISTPATSRAASIHEREGTIDSVSTTIDNKTTVSLDTQVSAGGANFSQGQRQLISMARALLRHSSIIVLDEATSSIDFATDAKIQATIREEFGQSLLLTVAHRLRTVIDYDRLIVLDKGQVAEIDTPWNLIQKEDGIFRTMCLKSGSFKELEAAAKEKAMA